MDAPYLGPCGAQMLVRSAHHTAQRSSGGAGAAGLQLEDAGGPANEQRTYWLGALETLVERKRSLRAAQCAGAGAGR